MLCAYKMFFRATVGACRSCSSAELFLLSRRPTSHKHINDGDDVNDCDFSLKRKHKYSRLYIISALFYCYSCYGSDLYFTLSYC